MTLASSSNLRLCFVCRGAPKPSCYRKGHINLCPQCKNMFSGTREECPHCNPPTDKFRPTMTIKNPETPMPQTPQLTVTAKMVYADGPDRTMKVDEVKEVEATEPSASVYEAVEESCIVDEEDDVPVTDDEPVPEEIEDSESLNDEEGVSTPVEESPAEEVPVEVVPVEAVPAEDASAPKTFEEKLSQLSLIPDRETEAEQEPNDSEVEVIPDTPEDAFFVTEKMMRELSQPRQDCEEVVEKPVQTSALPAKNGVTRGKSVKHLAAQLNQTSETSSCGRCSVHGKRAAQACEKKAEFHRPALTKTKTARAPHQIRGSGDESNDELGECF
ncbi:uncharacterized protein LDX57_010419 [Aspergillus melleus]|uniref:uncharacterized protein n=1 Tax=Aspergillus melleus TaxID=138277 RepID=UPI001E8E6DE1|nr:uncharacterized protein LDX57_010419 [Aspergillus melleus]KAH8432792.1 hypothetical protein LDX57_010419 [Aspergillus melleus]